VSIQNHYQQEAYDQWNSAHRRALWSRLLNNIQGDSSRLLDFNEVVHRLHLKNAVYRGIQMIPLDRIVGSVGRYQDFTRAFLPLREEMRSRWQDIANIEINPLGKILPPIDAYKVGEWYFVKDGNHRVSVKRHLGNPDIEAKIWEYTEDLPEIGPETNIDDFLVEAERFNFFQHTGLDDLRPDHGIQLSEPGGYTEMLLWIAHYQEALNQIDDANTPYTEAVTAWYDMIYETSVQIIERDGVLAQFPDRTSTDFFVWVMRHRAELAECCEEPVRLEHVIDDIRQQQQPGNLLTRALSTFRRKRTRVTSKP